MFSNRTCLEKLYSFTSSKFEMIINYFLYACNFNYNCYANKGSFNNYFTLKVKLTFWKKYSWEEFQRGWTWKHEPEPQAWFLPGSFHARFPVAFSIDEFIIHFKKMHTFSANTKNEHKIGGCMYCWKWDLLEGSCIGSRGW